MRARNLFAISLTVFPPTDILSSSRQGQADAHIPSPALATVVLLKGLWAVVNKATVAHTQEATRNWIAYLCESLVTSGVMPTWEAATYLTENLFGEKPNPRLLCVSNA